MTHAMHAAATGTGSEEGGDNTALAPSAEESALAQLLQAARNVANSGVDTYLQRLKQDRVDVGKQLATTTENITKVRELGGLCIAETPVDAGLLLTLPFSSNRR